MLNKSNCKCDGCEYEYSNTCFKCNFKNQLTEEVKAMNIKDDINDRIAFLNKIVKVQNESITVCYKQASDLVESNASIAKEIEFLYASMREPK